MIEKIFDRNILIYTMGGLFVFGILLNFVLRIIYFRMLRASRNMGRTKNKLLKKMKIKFETFYKLNIGVNNVDAFVDKYINNHKFFGIWLITWENLCGQVIILCALIGSVGALLGGIYEVNRQGILSVFSVGILTSGLLITFWGLLNLALKKELIRLNVVDYLDNYLKKRLEQEVNNPELIEEYKKAYFGSDDIHGYIAAGDITIPQKQNLMENPLDRKTAKREMKSKAKMEKQRKKEERKATRAFKKQTRSVAKIKRKENKRRRKLEIKQERMESRKKAKLEKLHKKEEKRRQAEIRKTLKLEKQFHSSGKNRKAKTTAEANKEHLKKEIKELRKLDTVYSDQKNQDEEIEESAFDFGKEEADDKINDDLLWYNKEKGNIKSSVRKSQLNSYDEQIIEDILKEYLA